MTALREIEFDFVVMICFTKKTNNVCEVEGQTVYFNQSTSLVPHGYVSFILIM